MTKPVTASAVEVGLVVLNRAARVPERLRKRALGAAHELDADHPFDGAVRLIAAWRTFAQFRVPPADGPLREVVAALDAALPKQGKAGRR